MANRRYLSITADVSEHLPSHVRYPHSSDVVTNVRFAPACVSAGATSTSPHPCRSARWASLSNESVGAGVDADAWG